MTLKAFVFMLVFIKIKVFSAFYQPNLKNISKRNANSKSSLHFMTDFEQRWKATEILLSPFMITLFCIHLDCYGRDVTIIFACKTLFNNKNSINPFTVRKTSVMTRTCEFYGGKRHNRFCDSTYIDTLKLEIKILYDTL